MIRRLVPALALAALAPMALAPAAAQSFKPARSEFFLSVGSSDMGYSDGGVALRAGVDFTGLAPVGPANLGLIAHYTYVNSDDRWRPWECDWRYTAHVVSAGPSLNLPLQGTRVSLQGRLTGNLGVVNASGRCGSGSYVADSGSGFDIGLGLGAKYQLNDKLSLRVDWDDWGYSTLSFGVGFKF